MCSMYKVLVELVSNCFNTYQVNPAILLNKDPIFSPSQLLALTCTTTQFTTFKQNEN